MNEFDQIRVTLQRIRAAQEKDKATKTMRLNEDIAGFNNEDFQAEKESFQQAVPGEVEFGNFVSDDKEITLRGQLKIGGNGQPMKFMLTTKDKDGLYLSCEEFQADSDAIDSITKLRAYFDVWYGQALEKLNGSTSNTGAANSSPTGGGGGADSSPAMGMPAM